MSLIVFAESIKELRAILIGTLDAGRQNFVFPIPYARNCCSTLCWQKRRATKDAGGASTRACVLHESPHSTGSTLSTTLRHKHKFREILILVLYQWIKEVLIFAFISLTINVQLNFKNDFVEAFSTICRSYSLLVPIIKKLAYFSIGEMISQNQTWLKLRLVVCSYPLINRL